MSVYPRMCLPNLRLFSLSAPSTPQAPSFPTNLTTLLLILNPQTTTEASLSSLIQSLAIDEANIGEKLAKIIVWPGEKPKFEGLAIGGALETLYWTGENAGNSSIFEGKEGSWPMFFSLLRGKAVVIQCGRVPPAWKSLLSITDQTYASLAQNISNGNTSELIFVYSLVREQRGDMGFSAVEAVLASLSGLYSLDLSLAADWFAHYKYGSDENDVIDLEDVSFKQFTRRLKNFCLFQVSLATKRLENDGETQEKYEKTVLKSRLIAYEAQVAALNNALKEKETVISQLRMQIAQKEASMTQSENQSPIDLNPTESLLKHVTTSQTPDSCFWKEAEIDTTDRSPSFQDIAQKKQLWITSAQNRQSCSSIAFNGNGTQFCITSMITNRPSLPMGKEKRKSPIRVTRVRKVLRNTGKLMLSG